MVVGQRQRQVEPRNELAVARHGFDDAARHTEDRDLRRIDDRREEAAADAAETRDREHAALDVVGAQLAGPGPRAEFPERLGEFVDVLAIRIADHGYDETVRRVGREADMHVALHDEPVAVRGERCPETRKLLERQHRRTQHERQRREFHAPLARLFGERAAGLLELGDVGFVVLGDVRDVDPARVQAGSRNTLDAAQRLGLDGTEPRVVDVGQLRQPRAGAARAGHDPLDVGLDVVGRHAALRRRARHSGEVHAEFTCEFAHGRARVGSREAGLVEPHGATGILAAIVRAGGSPRRGRTRRHSGLRRRTGLGGRSRRRTRRTRLWQLRRRHGGRRGARSPGRRRAWGIARRYRRRTRRAFGLLRGGPGLARRGIRTQQQNFVPGIDQIADLDPELQDLARGRGRDVHRRLLGLERDQRVFGRDFVAGTHQHLDHFHIGKVTEIGDQNLHGSACFGRVRDRSDRVFRDRCRVR